MMRRFEMNEYCSVLSDREEKKEKGERKIEIKERGER